MDHRKALKAIPTFITVVSVDLHFSSSEFQHYILLVILMIIVLGVDGLKRLG